VLDDQARCNRLSLTLALQWRDCGNGRSALDSRQGDGANIEKDRGSRTLEFFFGRNICPD